MTVEKVELCPRCMVALSVKLCTECKKVMEDMCPICLSWQLADQKDGKYICFKCQSFFEKEDEEKEINC